AVDGVNSLVREKYAASFQPSMDWRRCKFCWLGAEIRLPAFTFILEENQHGLFTVHAYPFEPNLSTFIVECREETWRKAGLDQADEAQTIAYCEKLFGKHLHGRRLLANRSIWRTFPVIRCKQWFHDNVVLMGDAAHTAHFSIGSGTKLAMEDAIELARVFADMGTEDVPAALREYDRRRRPEVERLQKTAQTSMEWFENAGRYYRTQQPVRFTFNQLTRSKRITYDNLKLRDPGFVAQATEWFAKQNQFRDVQVAPPAYAKAAEERALAAHVQALGEAGGVPAAPPVFQPFQLRELKLVNRVVLSPMCQYSATDGMPADWHLVHLGSRALGGAGLLICEATAVSPVGRITPGCTGIYEPAHVAAWKRITDFVHSFSKARIALQIGHAGRKASADLPWKGGKPLKAGEGGWQTMAPSAIAYGPDWPAPSELTAANMDAVRAQFVQAVQRAQEAGFDMIELHMAHGYLLSSFISPLTNRRTDSYGGSLEARMRFPLEVFAAARAAWPQEKPISVRISATEWKDGGLGDQDRVDIAHMFKDKGLDILDVSAGGVVPDQQPVYGRMFQLPFADQIRNEAGMAVMTVGNIQNLDQANTILLAGKADLVVLARAHLADPALTLHEAARYGHDLQYWPPQYLAAKPSSRKG
ncbi:MAG: FAD-dependent monooxygenase, partial [Planctomycetes bacterium]|nr:FAD-dependent monooxygenase [Planctomycetota bacterium]